MKQENKDLLLRDLCARLPYGVKLWHESYVDLITLHSIDATHCGVEISIDNSDSSTPWWNSIEQVKPYLYPLSSMTEEQEEEWDKLFVHPLLERLNPHTRKDDLMLRAESAYVSTFWLIKNHFDYRGLIPKGLAVDCTNLNIY